MFLLQRGWELLCGMLAWFRHSTGHHRTAARQPAKFRTRLESLEQRAVLNAAPIADDAWATIDEDSSASFGGYDDDNDPLTAEIVSGPSNGSVSTNPDGTITYTPAADFNGSDSFQFKVNDGVDESSVATVSLTISPVNDAPWAGDDAWAVWVGHQDTESFAFPEVNSAAFGDIDGDSLQVTFTSTPPELIAPGEAGSVGYTVTDSSGATASASFAYAVNYYANNAPVAADDDVSTDEDTSVSLDPRGNDSDDDGDALSVPQIESGPSHGWVEVDQDGNITYWPEQDFNGSDSFSYRVEDGWGGSATATVSILVTPVNDAPVADPSWTDINEDSSLTIGGYDVDGDLLSATIVNGPSHGSIEVSGDGTITYIPEENYHGADWFDYFVSDGEYDSATVTASITVLSINDAPTASDEWITISEDYSFTVGGNDVDGDVLTAALVAAPANGYAQVNYDGTITYYPYENYNGSDSFQYTVSDGQSVSGTATVWITIDSVNDAPWANDDSWQIWITHQQTEWHAFPSVNTDAYGDVDGDTLNLTFSPAPPDWLMPGESGSLQYTVTDPWGESASATFSFAVTYYENHAPNAVNDEVATDEDTLVSFDPRTNDSDEDSDDLSYPQIESGPQHGTAWVDEFGAIVYAPEQDYHGADSIVYRVDDGWGGSATATVTFTVNSINDAPIAEDSVWSIDEDTTIAVSGSDVDGDPLSAVIYGWPSFGTLSYDGTATLVYTPYGDFNGADSFQYYMGDGQLDSAVATVFITMNPVNDAPVAYDDYFEFEEDNSITFSAGDLLANDYDVDGDVLGISAISSASNGELIDHGDGTYTYTPYADFNGPDWIGYEISDGVGGYASATIYLNILPVADAPRPSDDSYELNEDESVLIWVSDLMGNDFEADGEWLYFSGVIEGPYNGQLTDNGNGSFTYSPNPDYNGEDSFTYLVDDGTGLSTSAVVTLTIHPVNDAPVVNDESIAIDEDTWLTVGGSDVDGDPLAAIVVTDPQHGTLQLNPDGTVTYTPHPEYFGPDSFQYQVTDAEYNSGIATVEVTVNPVNDAPSFVPGPNVTVDEDAAPYSAVWATEATTGPENESDQVLTYVVNNNNSTLFTAGGQPKIAADGTLTFTPAPNAYGTAVVTVFLRDNGGTESGGNNASPTHSFNITLEPVNDPPVNVLPSPRSIPAGTNLVFSSANGNSIAVQDDSVLPIQVMLVVNQGSLSLSRTTGLSFLTGDGSHDWFVCFTGTVSNINAALNGLTFHAPSGYLGNIDLTMATQDLGGTGKGVPQADFDVLKIQALPTLSVTDQTVNETDGTVTFTVELSQASGDVVTVDYSTAESTAGLSDFIGASGTLTFEPGETSKTVTISIIDDWEIEPDEAFYLNLSNAANALLTVSSSAATIISDDHPELSIDDATVNEDAGTVSVTFRLNRADHLGVTVDLATIDDTAISPDDYLGASGQIYFAPGESEKTLDFTIVDDFLDEADETFHVVATGVTNAFVADGDNTVTIVDNDIPPVLTVDDVAVYEYAGIAIVTFRLDHGAHPGVSFDFSTFDGTAVNPSDYLEKIGHIDFATGETEKTVEITIIDDDIREPDEVFTVEVANVEGADVADGVGNVTILSRSELSFTDLEVGEGEGYATITFRLNRPDPNGVSFGYTTYNDLAVSPYDYKGESGTVIFGPGEVEKTVQIEIIDDSWDERTHETFVVVVSSPERVYFENEFAIVTIVDNDLMGVVGYSNLPLINEGDMMYLHGAVIADVTWGSYHYEIDWGDETTTEGDLLPGITFFNEPHTYEDDGFYWITITVTNPDDEENVGFTTCTVLNVDPELDVEWTRDVDEGGPDGYASGSVYDPGTRDQLTVVMYVDGVPFASQDVHSGDSFWFSYNFDDDDLDGSDDDDGPVGTANIEFRVYDDDGGQDSKSGSLRVHNVDPEATGGTLGDTYTACNPPTQEDIEAVIGIVDPGSDKHHIHAGDLPTDVGVHTVTVTVEDDDSGSTTVDITYEIVRETETTEEEDDLEGYDLDGDGINEYEDYDGNESFQFWINALDDEYELDGSGLPPAGANVLDNDSATVSRTYTHYNYSRTLHRTIDSCTGEILDEWSEIHVSSEDFYEELGAATLTAAPGFAPGLAKSDPAWDVYSDGTFTYEQDLSEGGPSDDEFGVIVYASYTHEGQEYSDSANTVTYLRATEERTVHVDDQSFSVPENSPVGTEVGTVEAYADDPTWELTFEIIAGNDDDAFEIDASTGLIKVHSDVLDYETKDRYVLTVQVSGGGHSDTAEITIDVTDENDAPEFDADEYEATIAWFADTGESPQRNGANLKISATDPDEDEITYSIHPEDQVLFDELFTLEADGTIKLAHDASNATRKVYEFTVIASDGTLTDESHVKITISAAVGVTGDTQAVEAEANQANKDTITVKFVRFTTPDDNSDLTVTYALGDETYYGGLGQPAVARAVAADFDAASQAFFTTLTVTFTGAEREKLVTLTAIRDQVDNDLEGFRVSVSADPDPNAGGYYVQVTSLEESDWPYTNGAMPWWYTNFYVLDGVTPFVKGADDTVITGNPGIDRTDVMQSSLPDCGFMAALLAAADAKWQTLRDHVQDNGNGTYTITLWNKKENVVGRPIGWTTFTVSGQLTDGRAAAQIADRDLVANSPTYGKAEIWPMLFERAYSALLVAQTGNALISETVEASWIALVGQVVETVDATDFDLNQVISTIETMIANGATRVSVTTKQFTETYDIQNLSANHAYVFEENEGEGIVLHNPWGPTRKLRLPLGFDAKIYESVIALKPTPLNAP